MTTTTVLDGCAVVTMDAQRSEHATGYVVVEGPRISAVASTGTGVAHCPSSNVRLGAGITRAHDMRKARIPVGLGVDGAASNEACSLLEEVGHALLFARGGPTELTVRDALEMGMMGGPAYSAARTRSARWKPASSRIPRCGGWTCSRMWRSTTPVAALVFGSPPLELLLVQGRPVAERAGRHRRREPGGGCGRQRQ
jgi:8-oxoguanine deaminase